MNKIDKAKHELNKMINEYEVICNEELLEVSQCLDRILNEQMRIECNMAEDRSSAKLELEELINMFPFAVYIMRESLIIDCNKEALDIFGYKNKEDIFGLIPYELSPKYQADGKLSIVKWHEILENITYNKKSLHFQWMHKRKNGEEFLSQVNIINNEGTLHAFVTDISEKFNLIVKLREKTHLYHELLQNHVSVILVINPKTGKMIEANKSAIQYYGYSREEILSMNINEINILDDGEIKQEMDLAVREKRNYFHFTHRLSNGTTREVEVHSFPVETEKEKLLFSIIYDIEDNIKQKLMYEKLLFVSPYAVAILDKEQRVIDINSNFLSLFQYELNDIKGKFINNIVSRSDNKNQIDRNIKMVYQGKVIKQEGKRKRKDGSLVDVEIIGYPVLYHQAVIGAYIIYIDISHKKFYEKQLSLFKKILETNTEGVFITDRYGCIEWVNNAFTLITGYNLNELLNKKAHVLNSGINDEKLFEEIWIQLLQNGKWQGEILNKNKKGDIYSEWLSISSIKYDNNEVTHYVGVIKNLSEKKKIDNRIIELQQKDALTGLHNREHFLGVIDKHINDYNRGKDKFSIIVVDIDEFKDINDSIGHNVGDSLLIKISKRILSLIQDNSLTSRIDGDEYAILYKSVNKKDLISFSKQLLKNISKPYKVFNTAIYLNFNIGISRFPEDGLNAEELIRFANAALNKSKKRTGERIHFYSNYFSIELAQKFYMANYLFGSITNNELSVYYQPIFDISEKNIVGAEALLRWSSPVLGNVPPDKFIPVAEKTGQILSIGEWVIKEVCKQINLWKQRDYKPIPISVNVSVKQLERIEFADKVINILNNEDIKPQNVELEITESVSSGDVVKIVKNIRELKNYGIKISMDDFGTGFSSLGQLDIFELDKLKIDKVFINDLPNGVKRYNLVKSIIAMAKSLDLLIVAEGIETQQQLLQLKELGCQFGQGFLLSEPLPVNEIEILLSGNKEFRYNDCSNNK